MFFRLYLIGMSILLGTILSCSDESANLQDNREPDTMITDIDGNVYKTVKIGDQWWMAENLKVTHYRNGDAIDQVKDSSEWYGLNNSAYCSYNNDDDNIVDYGLLYNWYAVDDIRNIAPEGWHIPTDDEWKELEMYMGMSKSAADSSGWRGTDEGGKLKETGLDHWNNPNEGATNESGFSALPGGFRYHSGWFGDMGDLGFFWSATEYGIHNAWCRRLDFYNSNIRRFTTDKRNGFSVRCIWD